MDANIPLGDLVSLEEDTSSWDAQEATNTELRRSGLYVTHLFRADQVFLRPTWEQALVPITRPPVRWLQLFRPAPLDLILTKMMRGDDTQDLADIEFMIRQDRIAVTQLETAMVEAVIPDLPELRNAFERAKPLVRQMALRAQSKNH